MESRKKGETIYWRGRSLYLNITNRCINDCIFCVKKYQIGVFGFSLYLEEEPTVDEITKNLFQHKLQNYDEIVFTGFGEPLLRIDLIINVTKKIKEKFPLKTVRIDTNGLAELFLPNRDVINELSQAGINAISISLNAENKEKYFQICKPKFGIKSFSSLLQFAEKSKRYFSVQFTIVDIPQIDIQSCKELANQMNIPLKIRHYSGPSLT